MRIRLRTAITSKGSQFALLPQSPPSPQEAMDPAPLPDPQFEEMVKNQDTDEQGPSVVKDSWLTALRARCVTDDSVKKGTTYALYPFCNNSATALLFLLVNHGVVAIMGRLFSTSPHLCFQHYTVRSRR